MDWVLHESIKAGDSLSPFPHRLPYLPPPPPPPSLVAHGNFDNKISPSILLIIVILAVIFFISGVLHLLVRYLLRPTNRDPEDVDNVTAFQGQLQQLFHLHDAGVDQSFIDTLPVSYNVLLSSLGTALGSTGISCWPLPPAMVSSPFHGRKFFSSCAVLRRHLHALWSHAFCLSKSFKRILKVSWLPLPDSQQSHPDAEPGSGCPLAVS